MADNNIVEVSGNPTASSQNFDQYFNALVNDVVPRNNAGSPEDEAGRLGTPTYQWDEIYVKNNLYINGLPVGTSSGGVDLSFLDSRNYVVSGRVRGVDDLTPIYLLPSTSTNECTISATSTNLEVVIDGVATQFTSDVIITGLTSAPSSNNTCLVNDADLSGQAFTAAIREIPVDTIGTEISSLNGKVAGFSIGSTEYFLAVVDTTNNYLLIDRRGSFITGAATVADRKTISNNNTITLMRTAWVFAENTGTTGAVTYTNPYVSGTAPTSPATGDYWYDLANSKWKVWSGSAWNDANRVLIGVALINSSGVCVATRCVDFRKAFNNRNSFVLRKFDNATLVSDSTYNEISIYGNFFNITNPIIWSMATDLEPPLTEQANTNYYFYITNQGKPVISDLIPEWREDLQGAYHPYKTWRFIAQCNNDGSSNLGSLVQHYRRNERIEYLTSSVWFKTEPTYFVNVFLVGGGCSGRNAALVYNSGTNSQFGRVIANGATNNLGATSATNADVFYSGGDGTSGTTGGLVSANFQHIEQISQVAAGGLGNANLFGNGGGSVSSGNAGGAAVTAVAKALTPLGAYIVKVGVGGLGTAGQSGAGANGVVVVNYA